MRKFKIILGGLLFASFTMGFAAFSLAIAGEEYAPLPGFKENGKPIPKPKFRPKVKQ
jgi:hypothetical protein